MDWDVEKYNAARAYWNSFFEALGPRDQSDEECDAYYNALEDAADLEGGYDD